LSVFLPKVPTPAKNTTEAEMDADSQSGKAVLRWLHLFMGDLGVPFDTGPIPVPVAEVNAATTLAFLLILENVLATFDTSLSKLFLFRLLIMNVLLYFAPLGLHETKPITSPNASLFLPSENTAPILWVFDLSPLNMPPALVISELKKLLLKRKPSYPSVRGGDSQVRPTHGSRFVMINITHEISLLKLLGHSKQLLLLIIIIIIIMFPNVLSQTYCMSFATVKYRTMIVAIFLLLVTKNENTAVFCTKIVGQD
jgi:hypothetical protein